MTRALDATYSLGNNLSGVGVYSRELLNALASNHPDKSFEWRYRPHRFLKSYRETVPGNVQRGILFENLGTRNRLFHGLNQRLPLRKFAKQVATFHDLFVMTAEYSTPEFRARFTEQARRAAGEADRIIAVSQFTAKQVESLLGVERSRIRVIHHGIQPLPIVQRAPERIVLHVGAIQDRKNIVRLVEAFEIMPKGWRLVLAGSAGFGAEAILRAINQNRRRSDIELTGYVSNEVLALWYSRAAILAFPSLDEGFGMPILEAMRAGVPVVASNRSAIPEVCGDAAELVDALNVEELAQSLYRIGTDEAYSQGLQSLGVERASKFSWKRAAEETWKVYQELS